jgi:hypothetical protein
MMYAYRKLKVEQTFYYKRHREHKDYKYVLHHQSRSWNSPDFVSCGGGICPCSASFNRSTGAESTVGGGIALLPVLVPPCPVSGAKVAVGCAVTTSAPGGGGGM